MNLSNRRNQRSGGSRQLISGGGGVGNSEEDRCRTGSRKPIAEPATFKQIVLMLLLHCCRKILFYSIHYKVILYMMLLLFGSLLSDFFPFPRNYFAQKSNFFNTYFVKLGWGWTLLTVGTFVLLSSYIYCCGERALVRKHLSRLVVATFIWFFWTTMFTYIEEMTGTCAKMPSRYVEKTTCIRNNHRWYGFDISGHAFLLVYCNLIIMEEVRCMRGWERINQLIQNYEYCNDSPLECLQDCQLDELTTALVHFGPYVKLLFIGITLLSILWDFMLVCTILYFHSMSQKLVGGLIAIFMWFLTYRVWYKQPRSPGLSGQGPFKYAEMTADASRARRKSTLSKDRGW